MLIELFKIFVISFLINLLWEVTHSVLYKTCLKATLQKYVPLIIRVSFKDGATITFFYLISVFLFSNINILFNYSQLSFFIGLSLISAFILEKISIKMKRWEYSEKMPIILGVGITPLFQLAITGVLTFLFVFMM